MWWELPSWPAQQAETITWCLDRLSGSGVVKDDVITSFGEVRNWAPFHCPAATNVQCPAVSWERWRVLWCNCQLQLWGRVTSPGHMTYCDVRTNDVSRTHDILWCEDGWHLQDTWHTVMWGRVTSPGHMTYCDVRTGDISRTRDILWCEDGWHLQDTWHTVMWGLMTSPGHMTYCDVRTNDISRKHDILWCED